MVLWAIVVLLVMLLLILFYGFASLEEFLGRIQGALAQLQGDSKSIRRAAELWDGMNREPPFIREPEPTAEEKQRKDEQAQAQLRKRAEYDCGGWQTARIVGRRTTADVFECEFVVATFDRTYIAQGRAGSFYRDGKAMMSSFPDLDAEVRCAFAKPWGGGLGYLLIENSEGRILSLQIKEENANGLPRH